MKTINFEWIDACEQLPDADMTVLLAFADGEVWTGYRGDGWFYVSGDRVWSASVVTHWAEFPDPPASEEMNEPIPFVIAD